MHIANARGVPIGEDVVSPSRHSAFGSVGELVSFVEEVALATGVPVGIKSAVGQEAFWTELAQHMAETRRGPDFVTVDGAEGGTGAGPLVFTDHVALPFWRGLIPQSTRRLLFILAGVAVLVGSVLGFYFTSDAFDERIAVTVAARDIEVGETLSAEDLTSALVVIGSLPHVPWTLGAPFDFEGRVAIQPIPLNALVRHDMVIGAETAPVGPELEVIVPLDLSLATDGVTERDLVLLADQSIGRSPAHCRMWQSQRNLSADNNPSRTACHANAATREGGQSEQRCRVVDDRSHHDGACPPHRRAHGRLPAASPRALSNRYRLAPLPELGCSEPTAGGRRPAAADALPTRCRDSRAP